MPKPETHSGSIALIRTVQPRFSKSKASSRSSDMRIYLRASLIFFFLSTIEMNAQDYKYPYGDEFTYDQMAATAPSSRSVNDLRSFLTLTGQNMTKAALFAAGKTGYERLLQAAEEARMDKQAGAGSSSEGTTSIVS